MQHVQDAGGNLGVLSPFYDFNMVMRWTARLSVVNHYSEYIKQCQPNAQVWAASSKYLCKLGKKKSIPGMVNCKRCPFLEDQIEKEATFVGTINKKVFFLQLTWLAKQGSSWISAAGIPSTQGPIQPSGLPLSGYPVDSSRPHFGIISLFSVLFFSFFLSLSPDECV